MVKKKGEKNVEELNKNVTKHTRKNTSGTASKDKTCWNVMCANK